MVLASSTGCTILPGLQNALDYSEECNDAFMNYRNHAYSAKAWYRREQCYCRQKHLSDFEAGFRAGYEDVASGGTGCTPAFAPRDYWGWKYQSPAGQQRVAAWFAGFPLGAQAAEEDGLGNYANIQMSGWAQNQYQQAGYLRSPALPNSYDMGTADPVPLYGPTPLTPTPASESGPTSNSKSGSSSDDKSDADVKNGDSMKPEAVKPMEPKKANSASRRRVPLN
jgi:hypothetical protein